MPKDFILPDLGEGISEAQIVRLMIKPGDRVALDQSLMEVETDKAAVEIPSPYAGVAKTVHVKEGQTVNVGAVIVTIDDGAVGAAPIPTGSASDQSASAPVSPPAPQAAQRTAAPAPIRAGSGSAPIPSVAQTSGAGSHEKTTAAAAPAVRKLARELGVEIDSLRGSGPGGRVTREDVERAASAPKTAPATPIRAGSGNDPMASPPPMAPAAPLPGVPGVDKWGKVRKEPISQIRKTIAAQMARSAFTAVHVTHGDEANITELDRLRSELNTATNNDPKLTVMTFIVRATCIALCKYPGFNSSLDLEGGHIVYKDYINMGVAVDTERGLIVPVIRNADQLSMRGIAAALRSIAERIRTNQFSIEDLRGGTFTITNVGALGGTFSTPIINYPEVAILGLGRSRKTPAFKNGQIVEALTMPLNLYFDHRATDGANAARFCSEIKSYLENPAKFLLD